MGARISRRSSLVAAAAVLASPSLAQDRKPKEKPKVVGALPPHWLDEVIGSAKDANAVYKNLTTGAGNKKLMSIIEAAVDEAKKSPEVAGGKPIIGPSFAQRVRRGIVNGFENAKGDVKDDDEDDDDDEEDDEDDKKPR